ncbi:PIR protein [Plasmodium ovale]|uniref:PIR protein n=1 Tax=Plasmodium ovale TaxID=36330 RepID=A0A1C3KK80_PLAOA|nr:PIR protein [Plasmodium ovale]
METSIQEYDFFNSMDQYNLLYNDETLASGLLADPSYKNLCKFKGGVFSGNETEYERICAKFKYLNFLLFENIVEQTSKLNYHRTYMNFWLNYKIKNSRPKFDLENNINIKNINDDNLKLMTEIYDLYSSYNEIYKIIKDPTGDITQCSCYSKECVRKYDAAIKKCPEDSVSNFCKALNVFKEKYDQLKNDYNFVDGCKIEELKSHPSDKNLLMVSAVKGSGSEDSVVPSSISEDQGSTAGFGVVTGTISTILGILPISLILYKTTPFGSWISNRYFKKKNIHEIIEDEENYESLLSTSGSHDITSAHAGYKLSYNSL